MGQGVCIYEMLLKARLDRGFHLCDLADDGFDLRAGSPVEQGNARAGTSRVPGAVAEPRA